MTPQIDILMATYNGEAFLEEQIHSILSQSYQNFRLLICDDQSTDQTRQIIEKFTLQYPQKIQLVASQTKRGITQNFSFLLQHTQSEYIMFSDQDDIWLQEKIEKTFSKMKELESVAGQLPILVHTDLTVVDAQLNVLSPSFWSYAKLYPTLQSNFNRLLTQNIVTGCTMMINRSLANLAPSISKEAMMHDWWLALVGIAFGKIGVVNEPTILYRQHHSNSLGAQKFGGWEYLKERLQNLYKNDEKKMSQVNAFASFYASQLTPSQQKTLCHYLSLKSLPFLKSRYLILKHGFFKCGFFRNFINFFFKRIP